MTEHWTDEELLWAVTMAKAILQPAIAIPSEIDVVIATPLVPDPNSPSQEVQDLEINLDTPDTLA